MEILEGGGGGSLGLEIRAGGGSSGPGNPGGGGVKKSCHPSGGCGFFLEYPNAGYLINFTLIINSVSVSLCPEMQHNSFNILP